MDYHIEVDGNSAKLVVDDVEVELTSEQIATLGLTRNRIPPVGYVTSRKLPNGERFFSAYMGINRFHPSHHIVAVDNGSVATRNLTEITSFAWEPFDMHRHIPLNRVAAYEEALQQNTRLTWTTNHQGDITR